MTQTDQKLHQTRGSSREFLLSQTRAPVKDEIIPTGRNIISDVSLVSLLNELVKHFPDILAGKAFVDAAMARLDKTMRFGALVIHVDESARQKKDMKYAPDILFDTARSVNSVCESQQPDPGIWGIMSRGRFGCFFPDKDEAECLELARNIRRKLGPRHKEVMTMGIALYPQIYFRRSRILENACKAMEHAALSGPGTTVVFDAVSLNISGDKLYQEGDIPGAIEEFKRALLLDPSNVNVHNSLGVCYGVLGIYDKALGSFMQAIRLNQKEVMAIYNAGLINLLTDHKDKALRYFLIADRLGDDLFEAAFQIGKLYLDIEKAEEAGKFLEKAVKLKPDQAPTAFRYMGECYAALNKTEKAIRAYKTAIKQNPYDAASLSALGHLFDAQGENPEIAITFCQHSVKIAPDNGLFRHRLGMLYLKQNQLDDALDAFVKAEELGYDSAKFIEDIHKRLESEE